MPSERKKCVLNKKMKNEPFILHFFILHSSFFILHSTFFIYLPFPYHIPSSWEAWTIAFTAFPSVAHESHGSEETTIAREIDAETAILIVVTILQISVGAFVHEECINSHLGFTQTGCTQLHTWLSSGNPIPKSCPSSNRSTPSSACCASLHGRYRNSQGGCPRHQALPCGRRCI